MLFGVRKNKIVLYFLNVLLIVYSCVGDIYSNKEPTQVWPPYVSVIIPNVMSRLVDECHQQYSIYLNFPALAQKGELGPKLLRHLITCLQLF